MRENPFTGSPAILVIQDRQEAWYQDWIDYQADRGLYAHGIAEDARRLEDVFLELTEEAPDA